VGIGTSTPAGSSVLELSSSTKGFLPPRLALTSTNSATPVSSPEEGLLVYNTQTVNDVVPGFYYWSGTVWTRIVSPTDNAANITGTVGVANGGTGSINGSITGSGALEFASGGTNENVTLSPSGLGSVIANGNFGAGTSAYNGGLYARSTTGGVDGNWGLDFVKSTGVDDHSTRIKFFPDGGTMRKLGFYDSRNDVWLAYFDGGVNTDPNFLIPSVNVGIGTEPTSKLSVKGELRLVGSSSGYVGLAPAASAGNTTYTLPASDGTSGQVLSTNGSGSLSWASASTSDATSSAKGVIQLAGVLSGTASQPSLANAAVSNAMLADGSVNASKIADSSVTNAKIVSIGASKLTGTELAPVVVGSSLTSVGVLTSATVNGKTTVGSSTASAPSAVLEVNSTSQGFLPPRLTFSQRQAMNNPSQGLVIYCSNCGTNGELQVYNGVAWKNMVGGPSAGGLEPGQAAFGGTIFYIFPPGDPNYVAGEVHGLIAATSYIIQAHWSNNSNSIATSDAFGSGQANTLAIIADQGAGSYAAKLADDYSVTDAGITYSDWYLPSKDELVVMLNNVSGVPANYFWSSSQYNASYAWATIQNCSCWCGCTKTSNGYFMPIRAF
jgi:hypothetical protein